MKRLQIITAPTAYPITLDYLKLQLKLNSGDVEDDLLNVMIETATDSVQNYTGLQLMKATYARYFDEWCSRMVFWDNNPVASVVSIQYMPSGSTTYSTLPTTDYYTDLNASPGAVVINSMPALQNHPEAIKITFTSGYATGTEEEQREAIPSALKQAVVLQAAHWYMYRTDYAQKDLHPASRALLVPYRVSWV